MRLLRIVNVQRSGAHSQRERPEQLARAVGFEPTIPDLETGALGQAKLRPYRRRHVAIFQNWFPGSRVERLFPEPQSGVLAAELSQGWCARTGGKELVAKNWCRWVDLNNRPSPYESAALAAELHRHDCERVAPPHGFEPRSPHSKCGILPLDEGGPLVLPDGFDPSSAA
jgi:hypothetical protein